MLKQIAKPLIILTAVIVTCAVLAQVLLSGDTLADYAEKNPEVAYTPEEETPPAEETGAGEADDVQTAEIEAEEETEETPPEEIVAPTPPPLALPLSEWTEPDECEEYQPGFTKEPIGDRLFEYIRGLSFPVHASEMPEETWEWPNVWEDGKKFSIKREDLRFLTILHYDFNGNVTLGEIICNVSIADDLLAIFYELYENEYPLGLVRLVDEYGASDTLSMQANNTSCFNYRESSAGKLSQHAFGLALDINPFYNPYVAYDYSGNIIKISPEGSEYFADRSRNTAFKIDEDDLLYRLFIEHGFRWGGHWNYEKDYQHFDKPRR